MLWMTSCCCWLSVTTYAYSYVQICSINETKNASAKLVVGNFTRTKPDEETTHARENISVEHQLLVAEGEVDTSESVTLQPEKSSVPGPKEKMVGPSRFVTDRSSNVSVGTVHSPLTRSPLLQRHRSSSISAGKCVFVAD